MLFEGLFKVSPAKIITNSKVTNFNLEHKPTFIQVLKRTFFRKIPLNTLSFFGNIGWHDWLSKTTVSQLETLEKYKKWNWFIITFILVFIILSLFASEQFYWSH